MENQTPDTIPTEISIPTEIPVPTETRVSTETPGAVPIAPPLTESTPPEASPIAGTTEPPPSYVKLAMRNMVRKRGKSLQHFFLTTAGLLAAFVGLAYLTR